MESFNYDNYDFKFDLYNIIAMNGAFTFDEFDKTFTRFHIVNLYDEPFMITYNFTFYFTNSYKLIINNIDAKKQKQLSNNYNFPYDNTIYNINNYKIIVINNKKYYVSNYDDAIFNKLLCFIKNNKHNIQKRDTQCHGVIYYTIIDDINDINQNIFEEYFDPTDNILMNKIHIYL